MKGSFEIIGISRVRRENDRSFDVIHCVGEFDNNYPNFEGMSCCHAYVDPDLYHIGDHVTILSHKGSYIVLN